MQQTMEKGKRGKGQKIEGKSEKEKKEKGNRRVMRKEAGKPVFLKYNSCHSLF